MTLEEADPPARSLFSDASVSIFGAVGSTGIAGIASIVIARELGVTRRGSWAVIASLAVIVSTIASAGLPAAAAYASARLRSVERARVVQAALASALVLGALAAVAYIAAAGVIQPPAPTVAVVAGLTIPFTTVWYAVTHQIALTAASMRAYALAQIAASVVTLVAVVALATLTELSVLMVIVISASAQMTGAIISLVALKSHGALGNHRYIAGPSEVSDLLRPYLAYALITFATLSLTQIVQRVDLLLVNGYLGPHQAGLYAVAVQITDLMLVIPAALGFVMFRRGSRSTPGHFSDVLVVMRSTTLFGIGAALLALLLAGWAIPLVFGPAYRGSVAPFRWLLPGTIAFALQSVLSNYLAGRGRPRIVMVAWLSGAIVGVGADLVVIPAYGIVGAAVVSSISYVLVTAVHVHAMRTIRRDDTAPA